MLGGELANQRRPIALLTCVIYTKYLENKPPSAAAEDFPKNDGFLDVISFHLLKLCVLK